MKIAIDIDEVLLQFITALVEYHNKVYKTQFELENFKFYDLWKTWGGTKKDDVKKINVFYETDYFKNILPTPYSQKAINYLSKENDLVIITARDINIKKQTIKSIEKYFSNCFDEIYFSNSYTCISEKAKTKKEICDLLDIDILIEDSLEHSLECVDLNREIFLMDRPWNSCSDLPKNIQRVNSWKEIIECI